MKESLINKLLKGLRHGSIQNIPSAEEEKKANRLFQERRYKEAQIIYEGLISQEIGGVSSYCNLAIIYGSSGYLQEAIQLLLKALKIGYANEFVYSNLGLAYTQLGELDQGVYFLEKSIEINPSLASAYNNIGIIRHALGELEAASYCYSKSLQLQEDNHEASKNMAQLLLLRGDYEQGLIRYESRFKALTSRAQLYGTCTAQEWDGSSLSKSDHLLIIHEQGLGDTIMFMRYALYLSKQGSNISLLVPEKLQALLISSGLNCYSNSTSKTNDIQVNKWTPMLTLARHLHVTPSNPLITAPYINVPTERLQKWKDQIKTDSKKVIVGINWQGNPDAEKNIFLRGRSIRLELFSDLINNFADRCQFVSLQKGHGVDQIYSCSFKHQFFKYQDDFGSELDLLDSAAIVSNCDLIITTDTMIAHLAGAIGKETWVLLNFVPEWRWGLENESSFWYPKTRLFRQNDQRDWESVFKKVILNLSKLLDEKDKQCRNTIK